MGELANDRLQDEIMDGWMDGWIEVVVAEKTDGCMVEWMDA